MNHVILRLSPVIDHERLIKAWTIAAENHEVLRTSFGESGKRFVQTVLKANLLSCERLQCSATDSVLPILRKKQPEVASDIIASIMSHSPIRLQLAAPKSNTAESMLMISLHHAIDDAESFEMILDEVFSNYQQVKSPLGRPPLSPYSVISYQGPRGIPCVLVHILGRLQVRADSNISANHCLRSTQRIVNTSLSGIENYAASISTTAATLSQAIYGVALADSLETNDIVFGTVPSGRTVPIKDAHSILVPYITTLPQGFKMEDSMSLKEILSAVEQGFLESLEYQHTALRDIHHWTKAERPLFETLFSCTRKSKVAPVVSFVVGG